MGLNYLYIFVVALVSFHSSDSDCVIPAELFSDVTIKPPQPSYPDWSLVTLECPEGLSQSGPEYSYCYGNDVWEPPIESVYCSAQCNPPELPEGVTYYYEPGMTKTSYENGDEIYFRCEHGEDGARLVGPDQATCGRNGRWEPGSFPTCRHCPPPTLSDSDVVKVSPVKDTYPAGSNINLSCHDNEKYSPRGPQSIFCEDDGGWLPNPAMFTCQEKCQAPDHADITVISYPRGGTVEDIQELYEFGDVVENHCPEGKLLSGPLFQRCNRGIWLPDDAVMCE